MPNKPKPKTCFVIAPIGKDDSEERKRSDTVYAHIIEPTMRKCGYMATRADKLATPGQITTQIIRHLVEDDLVLADLTGHNANVFYELAIRQCAHKPIIQMMAVGQTLPFDVIQTRTIFFDYKDLGSAERCRQEIVEHIRAIEANPEEVDNPILTGIDLIHARGSTNPQVKLTGDIFAKVTDLATRIEGMGSDLTELHKTLQSKPIGIAIGAQADYIDGEKEAFEALTEATKRAREIVRSTRFFPDSVLTQPAYVSAMEQRILGTDGNPKLKHYYRIVAVNNPDKQRDINDHLNKFFGHPFELYLTDNDNAFEIVAVDDTDAFIHFYKEEKVIAATLHLRGRLVVEQFIQIFEKLKSRQQIAVFNCAQITRKLLMADLEKVDKIFEGKYPSPQHQGS